MFSSFFFFNDTATTEIYTLSLHDALPIFAIAFSMAAGAQAPAAKSIKMQSTWPASNTLQEHFKMFAERVDKRSEEHTSELQSPCNLVCRLLLEKKKKKDKRYSNLTD